MDDEKQLIRDLCCPWYSPPTIRHMSQLNPSSPDWSSTEHRHKQEPHSRSTKPAEARRTSQLSPVQTADPLWNGEWEKWQMFWTTKRGGHLLPRYTDCGGMGGKAQLDKRARRIQGKVLKSLILHLWHLVKIFLGKEHIYVRLHLSHIIDSSICQNLDPRKTWTWASSSNAGKGAVWVVWPSDFNLWLAAYKKWQRWGEELQFQNPLPPQLSHQLKSEHCHFYLTIHSFLKKNTFLCTVFQSNISETPWLPDHKWWTCWFTDRKNRPVYRSFKSPAVYSIFCVLFRRWKHFPGKVILSIVRSHLCAARRLVWLKKGWGLTSLRWGWMGNAGWRFWGVWLPHRVLPGPPVQMCPFEPGGVLSPAPSPPPAASQHSLSYFSPCTHPECFCRHWLWPEMNRPPWQWGSWLLHFSLCLPHLQCSPQSLARGGKDCLPVPFSFSSLNHLVIDSVFSLLLVFAFAHKGKTWD